jgi:Ca2+-binding EF-hand superfamily protein
MSSVSGISSSIASTYSDISALQRRHRPDTSEMAADLFSKLDTSGKGYIEQSDLATALSALSSASSSQSTSSSASASDIFSQLDSDGDGKITESELSTSLKKLADELDSQFNQSRMEGAMPPPPPPGGAQGTNASDTGFTKDELTSQLSAIGSSDSKRSSLISNIVNNFDKADTNSDGKVSFQEAMAYDQANSSSSSTSTDTSSSASTTTQKTDAQVFRQLMELLRLRERQRRRI